MVYSRAVLLVTINRGCYCIKSTLKIHNLKTVRIHAEILYRIIPDKSAFLLVKPKEIPRVKFILSLRIHLAKPLIEPIKNSTWGKITYRIAPRRYHFAFWQLDNSDLFHF
ncbi:hypothetical protein D3C71_1970890 [compost metagenome]